MDAFNLTKQFGLLPFRAEHSHQIEYKQSAIYWEYIQWQRNHWLPFSPIHIFDNANGWLRHWFFSLTLCFVCSVYQIWTRKKNETFITKSHPNRITFQRKFASKHFILVKSKSQFRWSFQLYNYDWNKGHCSEWKITYTRINR